MSVVESTRSTARLASRVRGMLREGRFAPGTLLPGVRALGEELGVAPETIRRGLKLLQQEGVLQSEPRRGFRFVREVNSTLEHCPLAYVSANRSDLSDAEAANRVLSGAFHHAAACREGSLLGVHVEFDSIHVIPSKLRAARVWGVLLDALEPELIECVRNSGVPYVMVNSWVEGLDCDVVLQDNYLGGFLATRHLIDTGAKRIGWYGPVVESAHSRERFAGASAALAQAGLTFSQVQDVPRLNGPYPTTAKQALFGRTKIDAILAFWMEPLAALVKTIRAARRSEATKAPQLAGWTVAGAYTSEYAAIFKDMPLPLTVTWNEQAMALAAVDRLAARREIPSLEPVRINIPTRLLDSQGNPVTVEISA